MNATATDKQITFINGLLSERDLTGTHYQGHAQAPALTRAQASEAITALKALPVAGSLRATKVAMPATTAGSIDSPEFAKGYFTVVHEDGSHTTYRFIKQPMDDKFMPGGLVISRLSGKDNENDYIKIGHVTHGQPHVAHIWGRFQTEDNHVRHDLETIQDGRDTTGRAYAMESGHCYACNRRLTTPESIERGLGSKCAGLSS